MFAGFGTTICKNMMPKSRQRSRNMCEKCRPNKKNLQKLYVFICFSRFFTFFNIFAHLFFSWFSHRFWHHFLLKFCSQTPPKPYQKTVKKLADFCIDFLINFEWIWDPIFEPSWPILAPSSPSRPLLKLFLALLGAILAPRCSPGAPQGLPDPPRPAFS